MYIYRNPLEQQYMTAQEQLDDLKRQRDQALQTWTELTQQIANLEEYIKNTARIIANDPARFLATAGLTQVCKLALEKSGGWVSAQQAREYLNRCGIDLSPYTNQMAVLHATLKRVGETWRDPQSGNIFYAKKGTPIPWNS
jgi:hypothetical protein